MAKRRKSTANAAAKALKKRLANMDRKARKDAANILKRAKKEIQRLNKKVRAAKKKVAAAARKKAAAARKRKTRKK